MLPIANEVFRTERLVVRPWVLDDAPAVFAIFRHAEVSRWTSEPAPMVRLDEAEDRIRRWADTEDRDRGFGVWAVTREGDDTAVGVLLLRPMADVDDVEIGWTLNPEVHGRGYATEAARGAIEHARAHGHPRVRAITYPDNEPSKAVCERLGMHCLGEVPDPWYGSDEEPTSLMWVLEL